MTDHRAAIEAAAKAMCGHSARAAVSAYLDAMGPGLAEVIQGVVARYSEAHSGWNCGESESYPGPASAWIAAAVLAYLKGEQP